ncbi:hypothetical protein NDU88_003310 [Pleurodeles waltl]|uniref:Uncharacterized protein n=1 Tax=Pleurodeles waltl TaxID=8319 RepID=A0AAV7T536_PLEWA|nr:hypothetical protein NDU88_003310 [Pleurodeles waltl]
MNTEPRMLRAVAGVAMCTSLGSRVEVPDAVTYLESWLRSIIDERPLTQCFAVVRAHCDPAICQHRGGHLGR